MVLPCSRTIIVASSSKCFSSNALYLKRNWQRSPTGIALQAGKASRAAATAASALLRESRSAWAMVSPVAGLVTGWVAPLPEGLPLMADSVVRWPLMKWGTVEGMIGLSAGLERGEVEAESQLIVSSIRGRTLE